MLVAMQGVVVDKIENRRLTRQHMIQVSDGVINDPAGSLQGRVCLRLERSGRGHNDSPNISLLKIAVVCMAIPSPKMLLFYIFQAL
jgi:hypothetical protein